MDLTHPVIVEDVRTAFPRDTRGMEADEIDELLRIEERALRAQYGVSGRGQTVDDALRDAMLAAWPSFLQQVRQVAQETAGANSYQVTYRGASEIAFPSFVAALLAGVADDGSPAYAPSSTRLVR